MKEDQQKKEYETPEAEFILFDRAVSIIARSGGQYVDWEDDDDAGYKKGNDWGAPQ